MNKIDGYVIVNEIWVLSANGVAIAGEKQKKTLALFLAARSFAGIKAVLLDKHFCKHKHGENGQDKNAFHESK